jgi:hypothetical protein
VNRRIVDHFQMLTVMIVAHTVERDSLQEKRETFLGIPDSLQAGCSSTKIKTMSNAKKKL